MGLSDRNNPYSFENFLNRTHRFDFYADDPFLQKTLKYFAGDQFAELDRKLRTFSPKVSHRWRPLADTGGKPNKLPFIEHYDAYNQRIDRIVRSAETLQLEKEIFRQGLFSSVACGEKRESALILNRYPVLGQPLELALTVLRGLIINALPLLAHCL